MDACTVWDKNRLMDIPKNKLVELLLTHIRNVWTEDGLYFLGIEKRFSTEAAIEIDREVWAVMGKIEARRAKEAMEITGDDIPTLFEVLKHTTWLLEFENKEYELEDNRLIIRNTKCRVQEARVKKGLGEFSCKPVRTGFLNNFVKEINPNIKVNCNVCPPDEHPKNVFCEWEFSLKG